MKKYIIIVSLLILLPNFVYAAITEEQALVIAQEVFKENVPLQYQNEYSLFGVRDKWIENTQYQVTWLRKVNNALVDNDMITVEVDKQTGAVTDKDFPPAYYPITVDTTPALTVDQAKYIAESRYGKILEEPVLIVRNGELMYDISVRNGKIGVNAKTGDTKVLSIAVGLNKIDGKETKFELSRYLAETGDVTGSFTYLNKAYNEIPFVLIGMITLGLLYFNRNKLLKLMNK